MYSNDSLYLTVISPEILRLRARLLQRARDFFLKREILEVETPVLSHYPALELHIDPFVTRHVPSGKTLYLQSSPEYAMKRLLASVKAPIYQIVRAFRNEESGRHHNPEFTMIEWYRPGFSLEELMGEVEELIECLLGLKKIKRMTYSNAFEKYTGLEPHNASIPQLQAKTGELGLFPPSSLGQDKNCWLDFLLTEKIEPNLCIENPVILYDYPASQANLAQIRPGDPPVAERFELYVKGIEICNGYNELIDPEEQRVRFESENRQRKSCKKSELPIDERLLDALQYGLPSCSGVSVGLDRVIMLAAGIEHIKDVISFPFERA